MTTFTQRRSPDMRVASRATAALISLLFAMLAPGPWAGAKRAEASLESAVTAAPTSPAAWLALARFHDDRGRSAQAAIGYLRALTLDPSSDASGAVAMRLWNLLVPAADEPSTITMRAPDKGKDPWSAVELLVAMTRSFRHDGKAKDLSDEQFFATAVEGLAIVTGDVVENRGVSEFWRTIAIPYLRESLQKGHVESMAYDATRALDRPATLSWLEANGESLGAYRTWSQQWRPGG